MEAIDNRFEFQLSFGSFRKKIFDFQHFPFLLGPFFTIPGVFEIPIREIEHFPSSLPFRSMKNEAKNWQTVQKLLPDKSAPVPTAKLLKVASLYSKRRQEIVPETERDFQKFKNYCKIKTRPLSSTAKFRLIIIFYANSLFLLSPVLFKLRPLQYTSHNIILFYFYSSGQFCCSRSIEMCYRTACLALVLFFLTHVHFWNAFSFLFLFTIFLFLTFFFSLFFHFFSLFFLLFAHLEIFMFWQFNYG